MIKQIQIKRKRKKEDQLVIAGFNLPQKRGGKVSNKGEDITTKYKLDISEFKKNINEANNQMKLSRSEFNKVTAGMDNWAKSTDGLSAKLKQLKSTMEAQVAKLQAYQGQ